VLTLQRTEFSPNAGGAVGGGGERSFWFRVGAPGVAALRLVLLRAWEADAAPADEFSITVQARSP